MLEKEGGGRGGKEGWWLGVRVGKDVLGKGD